VENHGLPNQVLTERGVQFHNWKGISHEDAKPKGFIVPVTSRNHRGKIIGFVRQSF